MVEAQVALVIHPILDWVDRAETLCSLQSPLREVDMAECTMAKLMVNLEVPVVVAVDINPDLGDLVYQDKEIQEVLVVQFRTEVLAEVEELAEVAAT